MSNFKDLSEPERRRRSEELGQKIREGIARAKARGVHGGWRRGPTPTNPEGLTIREAAERWGVSANTAHKRLKEGLTPPPALLTPARPQSTAPPPILSPAAPLPAESFDVKGDKAELTKVGPENPRTLADLIRVCQIDTAEWVIERWLANKYEVASKDPDGKVTTSPLFQIKAWLVRKNRVERTMDALRVLLVEDIRAEVKRGAPALAPRRAGPPGGGWLFEFAPFDLHMGKYAWDEETVSNYDVDIAADLFNASLDFLLNRAMKVSDGRLERVLCVFGNDVSHMDGKSGETTAGTRMDVDTRYIRVYRRICEIHRRAIDILRDIAPVDVKIVPGNHDELTSFHLGEILATRYEGDKYVAVDNSPRMRKYYDYGVNLFGFTHGDSEKVTELPLLMAREQPELWAKCSSREWHIGHKHISEKFEARQKLEQDFFSDKGVRVRRLTSLSAHDAWHTKHAYTDRRACEAFVFHRDAGFTDHISFNCDHFSGRPMLPNEHINRTSDRPGKEAVQVLRRARA